MNFGCNILLGKPLVSSPPIDISKLPSLLLRTFSPTSLRLSENRHRVPAFSGLSVVVTNGVTIRV